MIDFSTNKTDVLAKLKKETYLYYGRIYDIISNLGCI